MKKGNLWLIFLLLVLIIAWLGIEYFPEKNKGTFNANLLEEIDSSSVNRLSIYYPSTGDSLVLSLRDNKWVAKFRGIKYPVKKEQLDLALRHLFRKFNALNIVSDSPEDYSRYGLDSGGTTLKVFEKSRLKKTFLIGDLSFLDDNQSQHYIRILNEEDSGVYTVGAYLKASFLAAPDNWVQRGKKFIPYETWQTIEVTNLETNKKTLLIRKGDKWVAEDQTTGQEKTERLLQILSNLQDLQRVSTGRIRTSIKPELAIIVRDNPGNNLNLFTGFYQGRYLLWEKTNPSELFVLPERLILLNP